MAHDAIYKKGNTTVIIIVVIALIIVGAILVLNLQGKGTQESSMKGEEKSMLKEEKTMMGKTIAGTASPYIEFSKSEYDKAIASGKIIFLNFYANWCPICRAEAPEFEEGFNELTTDKVVGFRVNFNDSDTDEDEKALAQEFKITYQHTKVILKDGKEVSRSMEQWDKATFLREINNFTQ